MRCHRRKSSSCQSASKVDPLSACNFDPVLLIAIASSAVRFWVVCRYVRVVDRRLQGVLGAPSWCVGYSTVEFARS